MVNLLVTLNEINQMKDLMKSSLASFNQIGEKIIDERIELSSVIQTQLRQLNDVISKVFGDSLETKEQK